MPSVLAAAPVARANCLTQSARPDYSKVMQQKQFRRFCPPGKEPFFGGFSDPPSSSSMTSIGCLRPAADLTVEATDTGARSASAILPSSTPSEPTRDV